MEIGTEAAQFPEKEYINGIFVAVRTDREKVDWNQSRQAEKEKLINLVVLRKVWKSFSEIYKGKSGYDFNSQVSIPFFLCPYFLFFLCSLK